MTDETFDQLQEVAPAEVDSEEEFDDRDYTPPFIQKLLLNPQLLPREYRENFANVFEGFELHPSGQRQDDGRIHLGQ